MVKKIIKKKENKDQEHSFLLSGEKALLLAEGCKLNKQKKEIDKRLERIKEELDLKVKGDYSNSAGDVVNIILTPKFTDIDPKEFFDLMKGKKVSKFFWICVKVGLTEAKKYITEKEMGKLRTDLNDPIKRHTFK